MPDFLSFSLTDILPPLPSLLASILGGLEGGLAGAWLLALQDRRTRNSMAESKESLAIEADRLRETERNLLRDWSTREEIYRQFLFFIHDAQQGNNRGVPNQH
ncbi:hypothetical protein HOY80DRAFT_1033870 [Tuber brumale]|nr:hypothetical protein HOY80DRAFT_1033870 [Tuber brumale]